MTAPADPHEPELVSNPRRYRYYDLVMAGFVTVLLCSNLIGPGKTCIFFGLTFGAGNLFFPISYIFGDVLTEVYGYARARAKSSGRASPQCSSQPSWDSS